MVRLVPVAETLEDLDRVRDGRLLDVDRLEAPLERRVLFEVLAVLVPRGRADRLELAARQHRLEDARGVDRALGGPGAHERVQLVDEQHDVAARADLLEDLLQALLEVAAITRARDQRAEVERVDLLSLEGLGDLAADDVLREALHDRGLADAGLADQHRVVLGPARQHLHDPLDLLLAADHRVELGVTRELGEVPAELVEHHRALTGLLALPARRRLALAGGVAGQELDHRLADAVEVGAELLQDLRGDALALADEAEQDVLGADVVVTELQGLAERELQDLLGAGREGDVTRRRRLALADDLLDLLAHRLERDVERLERLGGDPFSFVDQAEQDVLGPDVVVVEHPRLFLREDHDAAGSVRETLEHLSPPGPQPHLSNGLGDQRTPSYPRGRSSASVRHDLVRSPKRPTQGSIPPTSSATARASRSFPHRLLHIVSAVSRDRMSAEGDVGTDLGLLRGP